ncbi:MAG: LysR family transcriptional regulator, partial [Bdellovibrionota bacterium]
MLNLKHLYYFHVFAQDLSISKAAKRLLISAPALSNQLKQLDGFLGVSLTRRVGGHVVITEPGEIVLQYTEQMFSAYEQLKTKLSRSTIDRKACFRVGVTQDLGARFAFDLISLLAKDQLNLSAAVHIAFDSADDLVSGLQKQDYDLVIGALAPLGSSSTEWASQRLSFPVKVFAPEGILKGDSESLRKSDQAGLNQIIEFANSKNLSLVLPEKSSTLRKETELVLSKLNTRPNRTIECNNSSGIVQLIERGFALGLVPTPSLLDFKCAKSLT